jgi:hypothetical protein
VAIFIGFFNINFNKFSAVSGFNKISHICLVIFIILVPFTVFDLLDRLEIISKYGYIALNGNPQKNIFFNFMFKYLPTLLIILFWSLNISARKHIIFTFFLSLYIGQLLLTGQRMTPILLIIINAVVYSDMYLSNRKRLFLIASVLILVLASGLIGLVTRGGSIANLWTTLRGFSKPYDEIVVSLISFEKYQFLSKFDFSPLFPYYSFFCDFGSIITRNNLCAPELRFQLAGMEYDWLSLTENFTLYLGGGTSGGGFIASLLPATLISNNFYLSCLFFLLVVLGISYFINFVNFILGTFNVNLFKSFILKYTQIYFWYCLLFSITGSISSLFFGTRIVIYSLTLFLFIFYCDKFIRNFIIKKYVN